jgi:hypothetical protein
MQVLAGELSGNLPPLPARFRAEAVAQGSWVLYDTLSDGFVTLTRIGTRGGDPVFLGVTNHARATNLFSGFAKTAWLRDIINANGAAWTWLKARPLRFIRDAGVIVGIAPPIVPAGVSVTAGLDGGSASSITIDE